MAGEAGYCRGTGWMQTKILEAVSYVDDVLELIKKGQVRNLTDHINTIDPTGNI